MIHDIFGDTEVETYAGPGEGVQTIKASEWEPYIRTMPHSEFPSASACMCKVQYTVVQEHGDQSWMLGVKGPVPCDTVQSGDTEETG